MRSIYQSPSYHSLDQGMIFNGGIANYYKSNTILGLVITPRCDISHSKVEEINYLPVIAFKDWLGLDGKRILLQKVNSELHQKLSNELDKLEISKTILARNSITEIEAIILNIVDEKKGAKIIDILKKKRFVENVGSSGASSQDVLNFFKGEEKHLKAIVKDLADNKFKQFYLLDPIETINFNFSKEEHWIVLNREIKVINYLYALKLTTGLNPSIIEKDNRRYNNFNYENSDELFFCFAQLKSPYIEHLIQVFLSNFNRIGVTDHDPELHIAIVKKINNNEISIC